MGSEFVLCGQWLHPISGNGFSILHEQIRHLIRVNFVLSIVRFVGWQQGAWEYLKPVSEGLPFDRFQREMKVQKPRPRPGTEHLIAPVPQSQLILCLLCRPLHFLSSHPLPPYEARTHLLLREELDPQAGKASFFAHFPANLCLNLDSFTVEERPIWGKRWTSPYKRSKYGSAEEHPSGAPQHPGLSGLGADTWLLRPASAQGSYWCSPWFQR